MFGEKIEDYEILEHLGKGGFAHVYRARCRTTSLYVAIKMIDKALMAGAGMIGRVRQEVTIHSRLKHPAILELYTFFEDAHYVYLILELAHNGELARHFKLGTSGLSERAAADIFRQVVSGVLYLHTHNIIHRDLSLNNLLLTKDLNVKIADFGLATQLNGPDEKHVTMCGTPNYISPEVASREMHGLPADVWGLGCMLYTLLVGSPPFHTRHVKTTLNRVINADYKIPSELSIQAQDLLQKLLCKDPIKRITLKGIMEHPFLSNILNFSNVNKQDLSRDSGFLTTLHSTQHSSKLRTEEKSYSDFLGNCREQKLANFFDKEVVRPSSINVLEPPTSIHSNGSRYKMSPLIDIPAHPCDKNGENMLSVQKYDSGCNSGVSLTEHLRKLDINKCHQVHNVEKGYADDIKGNVKPNINSNFLGVPPLCAERLPTISHRTRNAILKIEPFAVIVEFLKRKGKDREERITEVCQISKDGMKIIIFSADNSRDKIPSVDHTTNEEYSYHNLPQKHWKKYLYAARFVELVKAKTPKITLYSSLAKCQLMENNTDVDMFFYSGEKITYSPEGIKIIDKNLQTHHNPTGDPELKYLMDHFEECSNRMKRVQSALSCTPDECFPLIIGKRPVQTVNNVASPHQGSVNINYNTPMLNIGSFIRTTASSTQVHSDYNEK